MSVTHNTALRTDLAAAVAAQYGEGATLRLYSAAQVNPHAGAVGTLLATITLPASPYGTPANGEVASDVVWTGAGDAQPPAPLGDRTPVELVHDAVARRWRGVLAYDADLDALAAVRIVVTATIEGRPARPLEAEARFVFADGLQ